MINITDMLEAKWHHIQSRLPLLPNGCYSTCLDSGRIGFRFLVRAPVYRVGRPMLWDLFPGRAWHNRFMLKVPLNTIEPITFSLRIVR